MVADNNVADDNGWGSMADDGVVDGEGRQHGQRVSQYEACRMEEIDRIIATEGSVAGKRDDRRTTPRLEGRWSPPRPLGGGGGGNDDDDGGTDGNGNNGNRNAISREEASRIVDFVEEKRMVAAMCFDGWSR